MLVLNKYPYNHLVNNLILYFKMYNSRKTLAAERKRFRIGADWGGRSFPLAEGRFRSNPICWREFPLAGKRNPWPGNAHWPENGTLGMEMISLTWETPLIRYVDNFGVDVVSQFQMTGKRTRW